MAERQTPPRDERRRREEGSPIPPVEAQRADTSSDTFDPSELPIDDMQGYAQELGGQSRRLGDQSPWRRDDEAQSPGDPELRGGDPDASKDDASHVGDEAPGMGNPTPDQDIVDEIGAAAGVTYQDTEPLRAEEKIIERDEKRWELDPASAEDYEERQRELSRPPRR